MPLKLKLLPEYAVGKKMSLDILEMDFDEVFFDKIISVEQSKGIVLKEAIESYVSQNSAFHLSTYGLTLKTPYGDRLKGITAFDFKILAKGHKQWGPCSKECGRP